MTSTTTRQWPLSERLVGFLFTVAHWILDNSGSAVLGLVLKAQAAIQPHNTLYYSGGSARMWRLMLPLKESLTYKSWLLMDCREEVYGR